MNIAFATLLLFLILIPGVLFYTFYFSGEFSISYKKTTPFEVFYSSLVPSVLFHSIGILIIPLISNFSVDLKVIGTLLIGTNDNAIVSRAFENIENNFKNIFFYNLLIWFISGFFGFIFKVIVRKTKLDRKVKIFRFPNRWHYLISGEILEFSKFPLKKMDPKDIDLRFVAALVDTDAGSVIYSGVLADYELSSDGGLKNISLVKTKRRYLSVDKDAENHREKASAYYSIPGEIFMIPNEKIINLNITYYKVSEELYQKSISKEETITNKKQPKKPAAPKSTKKHSGEG